MLINCVAYSDGNRIDDLTVEEISDYVERPDCFVWVALRDATDGELDIMQEEFGLHDLAVEDARHGHQRPKIEEYDESVFAVIHTVEVQNGQLSAGEVNIFVGPNYILSVRNGSQQHFFGVRERCERDQRLLKLGAGFVFYALVDAIVDRYFPIIEMLEAELDTIEEHIFTKGAARFNVERLYALKRKAIVLRHAVTPLMEAVGKLSGGGQIPPVCESSRDYFRDVYDHLVRINTALDAIRDTTATAIQVNLSLVTIDESDVNKRLAAWAAIFAVATAFAGIWGMNFKAMPELQWEYGYPTALGLIATICVVLYIRFKRLGWL